MAIVESSSNPSSNLGPTFLFHFWCCLKKGDLKMASCSAGRAQPAIYVGGNPDYRKGSNW